MTGELGHYRIEVQLGSGGMGAVFRAIDLRDNRVVALKTLLASTLKDVEQRQRFQQEARLASSLTHPNIVTIFEVGTAQLAGESVDYIAMELIDGETLDKLSPTGQPLPELDAISYGIQIAHGLAAAHAANIIHRDLKPSNVMVSRDGVVKILDFGLAKWADPIEPDAYSETRSVQLGLTMAGSIIGSVAYMSPEQAESKPLDTRTDIFSFGSVLYRMASGQDPFKGASPVATLSAVLLKDPDPISDMVPGVSPGLETIIRKCLRKEPSKRWQSMADLGLSLEELREELIRPRDPPSLVVVPPAPANTRRQWLMAGAGLLVGLTPAAYLATRRKQPATFQRLTFRRGDILSALFAPRGEIVYTAHWDGSPQATYSSLPGSREARDLGLPSGTIMGINSSGEALIRTGDGETGTLIRIGLGGGAARSVLNDVFEAKWGPDGDSIAVVRAVDGKPRLEYPIGTLLYQTEMRPPCWVRVHPSSGMVAFFDYDTEVGDYDLKTVDSSRQVKTLSRGWRTVGRLAWSPDGKEVWMSAGRPGENPWLTAVTREGVERTMAQLPGFMLLHDVAPDGSLLVAAVRSKIAIHGHGSLSKNDLDLSWFDASMVYDITPDGTEVLSVELAYGEGRNSAIYLKKTDGSASVRIGYGNRPALSPDGKSIVCIFRQNNNSVLKILPAGAGEEKTLSTGGMKYDYAEWFPDQQRLLVTASGPGKPPRTYWRPIAGNDLHPVTPEGVRASRISPDGRWAVGVTEGKFRLFPIESGTPRDLGPAHRGEIPLRWTADGKGFYIAHPHANSVEISLRDATSGGDRLIREIPYPEEGAEFYSLAISPDAKWYAFSYQKDLAELYVARGIK
ncbi:MAG TPA: WD40 repeat domain-containing serine/threonine protein kinase [Bryobacteraceae bacterium]|jgi:Tol biopolymer transport system component